MNTGLDSFDTTVQETNLWLKSMMKHLDTSDRHEAYAALRATLHALRDRIGPQNAVHMGAQLPMLLRGLYYDGWRMSATPTKERHLAEFIEHVRGCMARNRNIDPESAARATFAVMAERMDSGEVAKVKKLLPEELRVLWPKADKDE